jgi:hypothetical protein
MVTVLLLSACGPPLPAVETIHGVQVVAIQADPPQPEAFDEMTLDVWVADGIGLGTEVLVWLCTPYEDTCAESGPDLGGVPLDLWTEVGTADPKMSFSTIFWPLAVSRVLDQIEDLPEDLEDGYLVVWALACVPGFCPFLEDIEIGPLPGSGAWEDLADGLAHPSDWVAEVPDGYASLAVKLVPLWRPGEPNEPEYTFGSTTESDAPTGRNDAPQLSVVSSVPSMIEGFPPLAIRLDESDPDPDDQLRSAVFVTSGLATKTDEEVGESVEVVWSPQAADADRSPQLFVVLDDERGGTAVWSSVPEVGSGMCDRPTELEFTAPGFPGDAVVAKVENAALQTVSVDVDGLVLGIDEYPNHHVTLELYDAATGKLLAETNREDDNLNSLDWNPQTCTASFDGVLERSTSLDGVSGLCAFAGALVDVWAKVTDLDDPGEFPVVTATTQAILQLDESLPCLQD